MSNQAADPHEYEWRQFLRGHRTELEDALLPSLAQAQEAGVVPASPLVQLELTHDQMRRVAKVRGITVTYPDGEPPPGTPMKTVTFTSPIDGKPVDVPMPAQIGPKGLRISINGIEAIMFPDPDPDDEATAEDYDEVEDAIRAALDVHAALVSRGPTHGVYGLNVPDALRDELVEAWDDHYMDHQCQAAASMLDRILEQLIDVFREAGGH